MFQADGATQLGDPVRSDEISERIAMKPPPRVVPPSSGSEGRSVSAKQKMGKLNRVAVSTDSKKNWKTEQEVCNDDERRKKEQMRLIEDGQRV